MTTTHEANPRATTPTAGRGDAPATDPTDDIAVTSPHTGEVVGAIPRHGAADVDRLVRAAAAAQAAWERCGAGERSAALKVAARRLRGHVDELAEIHCQEGGKRLGDARGGVEAGIGAIEQYAELGPLHRGRSLQGAWGATDVMVPMPYGVAAVITPWNDPIAIACQGIAAALAVGNAVVLKPSERTPLSTIRLVELLSLDLPAGVLQLALGDGPTGAALVEHPGVDVVVHTGSVSTGIRIAEACAARLKKAVLELGGNDACIVDEGVDPAWAAEQIAVGAFAGSGQVCVSIERVYVHEAVHDAVAEALAARAAAMVVGDPADPSTDVGPLVDEAQLATVARHVDEAVQAGATVLAGGRRLDGPGCHYPPTVLVGVPDDVALMREETFGPVAPLRRVASFDEGLELAARSSYGLAAVVLTPSQAHAQEAWRRLPVGTVKVNAAFGGAPGGAATPHGLSGSGFGYGPELLGELTRTRVVHLEPAPG